MPSGDGQCPFTKQKCIGDKCELWATIGMTLPGQLAGTVKRGRAVGCVFNLLALLIGNAKPPVVINPRPGPQPPS